MHVVRSILVLVHIVGFAMLLGGFLAQYIARKYEVSALMRAGLGTAIGSGLILALPFPSDVDLNYLKLGVKLGVAVLIGALFGLTVVAVRAGRTVRAGQFAAIGILAFANAAIATIWH